MLLQVALALAAAAAGVAVISALVHARQRRAGAAGALAATLDPLPAGVKHLAARVGELSDLGIHLARPGRRAPLRKPRLGALLGLR